MIAPRRRVPEWLARAGLGLVVATTIAATGLGALLWLRAHASAVTPGTTADPLASCGVSFDGKAGSAEPTLDDLRHVSLVELSDESGMLYRMKVSNSSVTTLRYYGLPVYPNAVGVRQFDPAAGESAESEDYDTGGVAALLTPDEPDTVKEWFANRLDGWSVLESPDVGILFRQEPNRRRTISIWPLPEATLTLIEYGVIPESQPPPYLPDPTAALKAERCWKLSLALEQYRVDTGKDAESVAELLAKDSEDAGYRGPYLDSALEDPYGGGPLEVEDGKIVGPGDVSRYTY